MYYGLSPTAVRSNGYEDPHSMGKPYDMLIDKIKYKILCTTKLQFTKIEYGNLEIGITSNFKNSFSKLFMVSF